MLIYDKFSDRKVLVNFFLLLKLTVDSLVVPDSLSRLNFKLVGFIMTLFYNP